MEKSMNQRFSSVADLAKNEELEIIKKKITRKKFLIICRQFQILEFGPFNVQTEIVDRNV